MSFPPIYEGWDIPGKLSRSIKRGFYGIGLNRDIAAAYERSAIIQRELERHELDTEAGQYQLAERVVTATLAELGTSDQEGGSFHQHLTTLLLDVIAYEGWFAIPSSGSELPEKRSELWSIEDQLRRVAAIVEQLLETEQLASRFLLQLVKPLVEQQPQLLAGEANEAASEIRFKTELRDLLTGIPKLVEDILKTPYAPDLEPLVLTPRLRQQLEYNLHLASGGVPGEASSPRTPKLPTRQSTVPDGEVPAAYLADTPLLQLFDYPLSIGLPTETRFEHHHIVAGSGHGKTQTLQHLILHDLEAVARGEASIVVIDSQSDLINNIAGLELFAPGNPLADRLVLIDPTDIEWPVALNLFDVGLERLDQYSQLDRERLTNSILELYDFVLGTLLDAGMTQKQTVIFRYITRLLLRIPNATIHTLRELLERDGYTKYEEYIEKLEGSAKAFFENEFNSSEFNRTKQQVLRRLYGILENQTFERMFSHPKSKLDLFSEMNAGKVILINTAKDLLKENGTEIFGRFFIAMIAQAAQERATLDKSNRIPTFVYVDEANDYFDQNIGIILSQARKYNVGMVLAHQYLGQLDNKLHEAIAANTSIKFAGGVSAKDARALAGELRTDAGFIEKQSKLSFAAFVKGETERAVSIEIEPGQMEGMNQMDAKESEIMTASMRERYAVHYSELHSEAPKADEASNVEDDDGTPDVW